MKRVKTTAPTPATTTTTRVEFILIPSKRQKPTEIDEFDGSYYQGKVLHFQQSNGIGTGAFVTVNMQNSCMVSCCPSFVYSARNALVDSNTGMIKVSKKQHQYCKEERFKDMFDLEDLKFLLEHDLTPKKFPHASLRELAQNITDQCRPFQIPFSTLTKMPFFERKESFLRQRSLLVRQPLTTLLWTYLVKHPMDEKQKEAISQLTTEEMESLVVLLKTEAWELVWPETARSEYGLKYGLTSEAMLFRVFAELGCPRGPPPHMEIALRIYFHLAGIREKEKHTLFTKGQCNSFIPCLRREERDLLEKQVYEILFTRAFIWVKEGETLSFKSDYAEAQCAVKALKKIQQREVGGPLEERGSKVPILFPPLTDRQTQIAHHIMNHWLTIVEGMPGTGKTALITWIYSKWSKVMLTSFVGMMVKSLQKRNGRRREAAYTIHHLITVKKYSDPTLSEEWFSEFQVLVVDEISNVSMKLFSKLMGLFPNLRKIILVGDHRQLPPIDQGWPMADLLSVFGSEMLLDNLRVVPELKALQEAPSLIVEGKASQIKFGVGEGGPISFINGGGGGGGGKSPEDTLTPIFKHILTLPRGKSLLNVHIVNLLNVSADGRHAINAVCETIWTKLGVLHPPRGGGIEVRYNLKLYPGAKITFTKNYNKLISVSFKSHGGGGGSGDDCIKKCRSDPIANGELGIITKIKHYKPPRRGIKMTIVDSEDPRDDPETKQIWIDAAEGVNPIHVDLGYCTTAYKTQGREFPYVIFWNQTFPGDQWTRPNAYVAVSRGKERVWISGTPQDFFKICSQREPGRRTCFRELLIQHGFKDARLPAATTPSIVLPVSELELMCPHDLASPIMKTPSSSKKNDE